jgi:hypothetical protein
MVDKELLFLLETAEKIANQDFNGRFTIMKSAGGWKAMFGMPSFSILGTSEVESLESCHTLEGCLDALLNIYEGNKMKST